MSTASSAAPADVQWENEAMACASEISDSFALKDRVAIVTGGASGFGRETARIFACAGARVVVSDVNAAGLEETAALVREAGGAAIVKPADVSVREEMDALADAAVREFGQLDIWFNSAGVPLWSDAR
jgi:3-oxoacyl-[acyl-carrier protein] reductase